jgi:hypothetical protein
MLVRAVTAPGRQSAAGRRTRLRIDFFTLSHLERLHTGYDRYFPGFWEKLGTSERIPCDAESTECHHRNLSSATIESGLSAR